MLCFTKRNRPCTRKPTPPNSPNSSAHTRVRRRVRAASSGRVTQLKSLSRPLPWRTESRVPPLVRRGGAELYQSVAGSVAVYSVDLGWSDKFASEPLRACLTLKIDFQWLAELAAKVLTHGARRSARTLRRELASSTHDTPDSREPDPAHTTAAIRHVHRHRAHHATIRGNRDHAHVRCLPFLRAPQRGVLRAPASVGFALDTVR